MEGWNTGSLIAAAVGAGAGMLGLRFFGAEAGLSAFSSLALIMGAAGLAGVLGGDFVNRQLSLDRTTLPPPEREQPTSHVAPEKAPEKETPPREESPDRSLPAPMFVAVEKFKKSEPFTSEHQNLPLALRQGKNTQIS